MSETDKHKYLRYYCFTVLENLLEVNASTLRFRPQMI